jgi:hypothetical protein
MWDFGFGLSACTISGNFIPSRTKNTGKLFPTRSKFPCKKKMDEQMKKKKILAVSQKEDLWSEVLPLDEGVLSHFYLGEHYIYLLFGIASTLFWVNIIFFQKVRIKIFVSLQGTIKRTNSDNNSK